MGHASALYHGDLGFLWRNIYVDLFGCPSECTSIFVWACELDGGGHWHKFRHITIAMISPAIFFNLMMGIISSFQSFLFSFLAPAVPGGPNFATYTLSLHMYKIGFEDGRLGYAAALAWLQFLVVIGILFFNYKFSGRWLFMAALDED
jgi:multiple sugar transport system permease protein